ncbi:MAG: dethiobiotin synthase [Methylacidiphilales bacterium]|nr:dethiobiotin synthase [Candidatus Methylacidiphilales bacterium]
MKSYFISGTDTGIGKTKVTQLLLRSYAERNISAIAIKPIACGSQKNINYPHHTNEDAEIFHISNSISLPYKTINPILLDAPISPHLAAQRQGITLSINSIQNAIKPALNAGAEVLLCEGAGGLLVPLNEKETILDLCQALHFPLIMVVGIRLGCINHALLSAEVLQQRQVICAGWYANCLDESLLQFRDVIKTIEDSYATILNTPLLGIIPYNPPLSFLPSLPSK